MKTRPALAALLVAAATLVITVGASSATDHTAGMRILSQQDMVFTPKSPDMPQIAVVHGNREAGPSSMVMKKGKGAFPMHSHTANYQLVVIQGTMKHWDETGSRATAKPIGPGGFRYQPANQLHADACESEECTWFITFDGPHDFHPVATTSK